jgi:hypothetical protein
MGCQHRKSLTATRLAPRHDSMFLLLLLIHIQLVMEVVVLKRWLLAYNLTCWATIQYLYIILALILTSIRSWVSLVLKYIPHQSFLFLYLSLVFDCRFLLTLCLVFRVVFLVLTCCPMTALDRLLLGLGLRVSHQLLATWLIQHISRLLRLLLLLFDHSIFGIPLKRGLRKYFHYD